MSANPVQASVTYLEPIATRVEEDLADAAVLGLTRQLDTQRSANKALLAAVHQLDCRLCEQRRLVVDLEAQKLEGEAVLATTAAELAEEKRANQRLYCDRALAEHQHQQELDKPGWRRLLRR